MRPKPSTKPERPFAPIAGGFAFADSFENLPISTVIIDARGLILNVNAQTEQLWGYARAELLHEPLDRFLRPYLNDQDWLSELSASDIQSSGSSIRAALTSKDGAKHSVEVRGTTKNGRTILCVLDTTHASDRAELEELRRARNELEQFIYIVCHDLQEPLRMVSSFTTRLAQRLPDNIDEKSSRWVKYIVDGTERMKHLLDDLLAYAKVDGGQPQLSHFEVGSAVQDALLHLRLTIEDTKAEIECGDLPSIFGDRMQMSHLFQNLIGNAMRFTGDKAPKIKVSCKRIGNDWVFAVQDNGIGIPQEHYDRIFLPFQRLHTRQQYPGSGLGLSIARKIVESHRGRIWLISVPNHGSTFYFSVPIAPTALRGSVPSQSAKDLPCTL